tara:strand:- start:792 stop:1304 length:513 start_codon:yes stop_codon:yes gene_type:complete
MTSIETSNKKQTNRTIKNKVLYSKIEIEGKQYRCVSFFVDSPAKAKEEDWSVFTMENKNKILIDKLTLAVMAECECEFLTRESDKNMSEPPIVAVELQVINTDKVEIKEEKTEMFSTENTITENLTANEDATKVEDINKNTITENVTKSINVEKRMIEAVNDLVISTEEI